ncbi:hypothetical protein ACGFX4_31530 [Kitasatospora sp. NPDC048365]|uniref:hypothetical protein n=1 Tax=Kitasatospora sp. NPDC048365 TaxID=3364050 RepID=UPI0037248C60
MSHRLTRPTGTGKIAAEETMTLDPAAPVREDVPPVIGPAHALGPVLAEFFEPAVHRVAITEPPGGPLDAAAEAYGLRRYRIPPTPQGRLDVEQLLRLPVKGILLAADPLHGLDRLLDRFPGPVIVLAGPGAEPPPHERLVLLRATA